MDYSPVSETYLREAAEREGYPVTHHQFVAYRAAGLIPTPDDEGKYPAWAAFALIRIRQLSQEVRALPRRVVRLRSNYFLFPVPGDKLRNAMVALIPMVAQPKRKMRRLARALGEAGLRRVVVPPLADWEPVLSQLSREQFEMKVTGWYAFVRWLPSRWDQATFPLADIPLEEVVLLFAIVDVATARSPLTSYNG